MVVCEFRHANVRVVPYYQPETAFQIFDRVMFNKDVATGKEDTTREYSTTGSSSAFTPSEYHFESEEADCYLWDILETCTQDQKAILRSGKAIVKDFVLVGQDP